MASVESKIAGSITGVAVAIIFAFVIVPEIKERRAVAAMNAAMNQLNAEMERDAVQSRAKQSQAKRRSEQVRAANDAAMRLRPGEQCLSGSVVKLTRRDGVPSYEQVTQGGQPVKCAGNLRL